MWPMLLNMTRDECRLTLRRLELEAYANMINVFRAQGSLEDNRKKLLEELRAVLHISSERHSAEARRVSNDELLATIAEQLSGPNTGIGWICEGRRKVPLMPRGIPQTMYTEIADKAAEAAVAENKEIKKRLEAEKLTPKSNEEVIQDAGSQTAESALQSQETMDEITYPPIATEDHTIKLWETELIPRKRKVTEGNEEATTSKNMRNIPVNTNQKHLNLSQLYSKFSQPATSKQPSQSKHSYNQVSKVSSKPSHGQRAPHKHRTHKSRKPQILLKSTKNKSQDIQTSPSKHYSMDYAGPPNTFQASYAQSVLGSKSKAEYMEEMKAKVTDSPTMQLLTQPATVPHDLEAESAHPGDHAPQPSKHTVSGKPCQLILKNRDTPDKKLQMGEVKLLQKPTEVKVLSNRQVVVASGSAQKSINTPGKLVTTKVIGSIPKPRPPHPHGPVITDKMIVVSKPAEARQMSNAKMIVTSSANTPSREGLALSKTAEMLTPKGIPATDLKVSSMKSGRQLVVLPMKSGESPMPLIHFKGIPTTMKLVPVPQPNAPVMNKATMTVVSKPSTVPTPGRILGVEPIKTANLADIVPAKGVAPSTPKITNPIIRPGTKGNVIVVQKGSTIGKALTLAKNGGGDMSKIIMGKNVNQLLQAQKAEADAGKRPGNVIVLELNDEQSGRATTMSEILDAKRLAHITPETPVLFDDRIADDANASSLDSAVDGLGSVDSDVGKDKRGAARAPGVTDWETELDASARKKDGGAEDKLNSLHVDLGMSSESESESEYMSPRKPKAGAEGRPTPSGEMFSSSGALTLATRTLLSQLQDDGSSSNDSSFALKKADRKELSESDALTKAKEKLSEKVAEATSQRRRIDVYSTAIPSGDINLDSFSYLEEGMLAADDVFEDKARRRDALSDQLSRLLGEDDASADSQPVSDEPLNK